MLQTLPGDGESNSALEDAHKHVAGVDIEVKGKKCPLRAARGALLKTDPPKNELFSATEYIQITIVHSS